MKPEIQKLWTLIEPYVEDAGLELVELDFGREPEGQVLRLYIDVPWDPEADQPGEPGKGQGVGFADCERVSRDVSAALDVEDIIKVAYRLEVSSPGLDRPIRRAKDFRRFIGRRIKLRAQEPILGRKNFTGTILGTEGTLVTLDCDGATYVVDVSNVVKAHLVPDWTEAFRQSESRQKERSAT
jgi:ribosome maturation factor RimP